MCQQRGVQLEFKTIMLGPIIIVACIVAIINARLKRFISSSLLSPGSVSYHSLVVASMLPVAGSYAKLLVEEKKQMITSLVNMTDNYTGSIFHLTYFSFLADPTSKVLHI
jgi:hypothetical protein